LLEPKDCARNRFLHTSHGIRCHRPQQVVLPTTSAEYGHPGRCIRSRAFRPLASLCVVASAFVVLAAGSILPPLFGRSMSPTSAVPKVLVEAVGNSAVVARILYCCFRPVCRSGRDVPPITPLGIPVSDPERCRGEPQRKKDKQGRRNFEVLHITSRRLTSSDTWRTLRHGVRSGRRGE